jgi:hypothetical protein
VRELARPGWFDGPIQDSYPDLYQSVQQAMDETKTELEGHP